MATRPVQSVEINLLGTVEIRGEDGNALPARIAGRTLELFGYLVSFNHRSIRRDHLADLLWEDCDPERSRAALNTAVWRVRRMVEKLSGVSLQSDPHVVRLDVAEGVRLDTADLKAATATAAAAFDATAGLPTDIREALGNVLAHSAGNFLDGASSSWVLVEREEYFNIRLRGLTLLMQDAGLRGAYEDALSCGRRILAEDPFREAVQCEMLWLYVLSGRRAIAIQHYRDYEALLKAELGIAPMAETRAMLKLIYADETPAAIDTGLFRARQPLDRDGFGHVVGEIERGRRQVYRNILASGA